MTYHHTLGRLRPSLVAASTGLGLLLLLGGCAGKEDAPDIATAGTAKPSASAGAGSVLAQYIEAQRKWVKCYREQGLDLPDPDAKGAIDFSKVGGNGKLKTDPKFLAATEKCASLSPTIPAELKKEPPQSAEVTAHRREYARCMRANGAPNAPDPGPDGNYPDAPDNGATESPQQVAAEFRAGQICEPVLDGKPPTTPDPNVVPQG
jgi:hypothetical protein